jgi:uncharacterized repeat protein (TIGR01451 family)
LTEQYPAQTAFQTSSPSPTSGNDTFALGNLSAGQSFSVNITVLVSELSERTNITNLASISYQNGTGALLSASITENTTAELLPQYNVSALSIAKTATPEPVNAGAQLTYTIMAQSTGNGTAFNVTLNETYPAQVVFINASLSPENGTNNIFSLGSIAPNTTASMNIIVLVNNVTNGTVLTNTVNATYLNETTELLTAGTSLQTAVLAPIFNISSLSISKSDASDPVENNTLLNYTINVTSTGNGTAYNVIVNDTYPAEVSFVSASPPPDSSANTTFSLGNLSPGSTAAIRITARVGNVTNNTRINNTVIATFQNETGNTLEATALESTLTKNWTYAPPPAPPPSPGSSSGSSSGSSGKGSSGKGSSGAGGGGSASPAQPVSFSPPADLVSRRRSQPAPAQEAVAPEVETPAESAEAQQTEHPAVTRKRVWNGIAGIFIGVSLFVLLFMSAYWYWVHHRKPPEGLTRQ